MNRIQKMAWWMLIWMSAGIILAAIAVTVSHFIIGMPWSIAKAGLAFLGIAGLGGLAPLIFKKYKGKVTCDERDQLINSRAAVAGFCAAFLVTGLGCMLPFSILGTEATISVTWLPNIFGAAGFTVFLVHSIAILVQYGRRAKDNE
jgi:hypothetical protein